MRLCHGLLCDRTADVMARGKPWCRPCYLKRFGFAPVQDGNPSPAGAKGAPSGLPSSGDGPRRAASVDGVSPPPLTLTWEELAAILDAERQWWEVEHDLKILHGMTLNDLAARLTAELEATA